VNQNGAPIIHVSSGCAHSYDPELLTWIKLSEKWWAGGSSAWQARSRTGTVNANRGVVATIENAIGEQTGPDDGANLERPNWWEAALTLGHLETRLQATKVLESPAEYKQALLVYAKRIAEDGFRGKAEELVKELFGPLYWCVLAGFSMVERDLIIFTGGREGTIHGHQHYWDFTSVNFSVKC
jgi:protein HIRA/HIR1